MTTFREKRSWRRLNAEGLRTACSWEDIGHGICLRCGQERRLYVPAVQPDLAVCATCSQGIANASLPNPDTE